MALITITHGGPPNQGAYPVNTVALDPNREYWQFNGSIWVNVTSSYNGFVSPAAGTFTPVNDFSDVVLDINSKAPDTAVVHNSGNETVGGVKTFMTAPIVPAGSFPESAITNLTTDLAAKATDSTVVHINGTETIQGSKTFAAAPIIPSNSFPESSIINLTSDLAAKALDIAVIHNTGNETISGVKTFGSPPILPNNTISQAAVTNGYTDLSSNQSVSGTKTFVSAPVVPSNSFPETAVTNLTTDLAAKALSSRQVIAGTGLTGGGDLTADRTVTVNFGTGSGTVAQGNDSRIVNALQTTTGLVRIIANSNINFLTTGATVLYTTENNGQRFIPMFLNLEVKSISGSLISAAIFNLGTNSPNYTNLLSTQTAATALLGAINGLAQYNILTISTSTSIPPNTALSINITTGAIGASVYTLRPDIIGYYV